MHPRCEQALESLWVAGVSAAPDEPELVEARRHLAACPPCRAFLRRDAVLAARLRDLRLCGATPCPERLRALVARDLWESVGDDPAHEGPSKAPASGIVARFRQRRWPAWAEGAAAAVVAAVLIGTGLMLSRQLDAGLRDEAFVEEFRRTALPEIVRPNVSPEEVTAFYRTQFGSDGPALMLDAPVTKVAVCNLEGRLGALVEYDLSGERVVFYQVPRTDEGGRIGDMRTASEGDLTVVRWVDTSYDYALVGSLPGEDLARIARSART
jgi:hypothetical protein